MFQLECAYIRCDNSQLYNIARDSSGAPVKQRLHVAGGGVTVKCDARELESQKTELAIEALILVYRRADNGLV